MFKVRVVQVLVETQFLNREDAERAVRELRRDYPQAVVELQNTVTLEEFAKTPEAKANAETWNLKKGRKPQAG